MRFPENFENWCELYEPPFEGCCAWVYWATQNRFRVTKVSEIRSRKQKPSKTWVLSWFLLFCRYKITGKKFKKVEFKRYLWYLWWLLFWITFELIMGSFWRFFLVHFGRFDGPEKGESCGSRHNPVVPVTPRLLKRCSKMIRCDGYHRIWHS